MKIPGSSSTEGDWGFKEVVPAGEVLGLMGAEMGKTSSFAKNPGEDKLVLFFDIIEGPLSLNYKEWGDRDGKNHYLQLHLPLSGMAKIVFVLNHLAEQTGGKAEQIVKAAIKKEDIDETQLYRYKLKTGAILGYNRQGFIGIKELVTVQEGRDTGPTGEPKPVQASTGNGNSNNQYGDANQDDGFGAGEAEFEGGF